MNCERITLFVFRGSSGQAKQNKAQKASVKSMNTDATHASLNCDHVISRSLFSVPISP